MSKHRHQSHTDHAAHHEHAPKREQFVQPARRTGPSWNVVIVAGAIVFFGVMLLVTVGGRSSGPQAETITGAGQDLTLPAAQFDDGKARFYRYVTAAGREIRFFVMKSSDGVVRAAFDACDTCYREKKGYHQEGDTMVCNNCGKAFHSKDINVLQGGCNPAPLERSTSGGRVTLSAAALNAGASYF